MKTGPDPRVEPETVTVNGMVFHTWAVNYILWGGICRLIHDDTAVNLFMNATTTFPPRKVSTETYSLQESLLWVGAYGFIGTLGGIKSSYRERVIWARVGYNYYDEENPGFSGSEGASIKSLSPNKSKFQNQPLNWRLVPPFNPFDKDGGKGILEFDSIDLTQKPVKSK